MIMSILAISSLPTRDAERHIIASEFATALAL